MKCEYCLTYFVYQHFLGLFPQFFGNSFMFYFGVSVIPQEARLNYFYSFNNKTILEPAKLLKPAVLLPSVRFWLFRNCVRFGFNPEKKEEVLNIPSICAVDCDLSEKDWYRLRKQYTENDAQIFLYLLF